LFNLYNIFKSSKHSSYKKILFSHSFTCLHSSRVSLNWAFHYKIQHNQKE
jgi:hypothetical protein